ncbi:MAG TPA: GNAT family N-acetyltransferase [Chitinophaga sp.]|uniref:GNAT family N-acetyltransferase n=1 Tax=Chitinophaga sp. TaxID=1869181 RepID=UPI002CA6A08E|nr:GNAT family N-acetyltransferase [Chitinophaga sp.]HVI44747.1 GNAT family N-acetyltransferase [Chitinophaga sp.]
MIKATLNDKAAVISTLVKSFDTNKSVNYIVKQDSKRVERIRKLMAYSFDLCYAFGDVFLSEDRKACVLTLLPDRKKSTFKTTLMDINLVLSVIGVSSAKKAMDRDARIKKGYPSEPIVYLWFIGVDPAYQGKGIGGTLLDDVVKHSTGLGRPVYLETSMVENLPWYEKHGFNVYQTLDFSHGDLYCLKNA